MTEQNTNQAHRESVFRWQSYGTTHVGKARKLNEDCLLDRPQKGLWVVADGMGGHSAGDTASQLVVENLDKLPSHNVLNEFVTAAEDALLHTNASLLKLAKSQGGSTIGTTVAMMCASDKFCYYAWVGDSRVYRLRDGALRQLTTDHSQVERHIEMGLLNRREARTHPHGNVITRAVGVTPNMYLDMDMQEMQAGDRYLLCSDGLTKHIDDPELQELLGKDPREALCAELVEITLERGALDNLTLIIVDISTENAAGQS